MHITRRQMLRSTLGSTAFMPFLSTGAADVLAAGWQQAADPLAARRAEMGAVPIVSTNLAENLPMLSGPGGNVIVLTGADGKLVVDSFVQPAWPALKQLVDKLGTSPIKLVVDTHWHFDHTD